MCWKTCVGTIIGCMVLIGFGVVIGFYTAIHNPFTHLDLTDTVDSINPPKVKH